MTTNFIQNKTEYSDHYAFGYYPNGFIYLVRTNDGKEVFHISDYDFKKDCAEYERALEKSWSQFRLPCEKLHELWEANQETIKSALGKIAEENVEWVYAVAYGVIPYEDNKEVLELIKRFFNKLAVIHYEETEQSYDFQVWQKGVEKENIKNAKTKKAKEYHEHLYASLY